MTANRSKLSWSWLWFTTSALFTLVIVLNLASFSLQDNPMNQLMFGQTVEDRQQQKQKLSTSEITSQTVAAATTEVDGLCDSIRSNILWLGTQWARFSSDPHIYVPTGLFILAILLALFTHFCC